MKPGRHTQARHDILIADSNYLFRKGLRALFGGAGATDFHPIREAADATGILDSLEQRPAEILLISEDLLRVERVVACIHHRCTQMKVVCLTSDPPGGESFDALPAADLLVARSHAPVRLLEQVKNLIWPEPAANRQTDDLHALVAGAQMSRPDVLTNREKEVVRLLTEGLTVREAADELGLSCKTVEAHTLNLMRKLDIHNRPSLIEYALASGIGRHRVTV